VYSYPLVPGGYIYYSSTLLSGSGQGQWSQAASPALRAYLTGPGRTADTIPASPRVITYDKALLTKLTSGKDWSIYSGVFRYLQISSGVFEDIQISITYK